jgi:ABC-type uncharacterized transport system
MGKSLEAIPAGQRRRKSKEDGNVRVWFLVLAVFLFSCGLTALWLYRGRESGSGSNQSDVKSNSTRALSQSTLKVLARVASPVEIRFYSILDPATVPEPLKAYSARVDQLLTAYEQLTNRNVKISRYKESSDANASAASADGIKPFNLDKGDACYLGIALASGGQKESLPRLDPDWEPAIEFDLTRAIARVIETPTRAASTPASQKLDPLIAEEVKKTIPNLESVSQEEGKRILREAALKEFMNAVKEMEVQIKDAEQRVKSAQSPAEQETATKNLRELKTEQTEKLKEFAAKSEAQVQALQLLKQGGFR